MPSTSPGLSHDQRVAQGLSTAAFHCVNAVPLACNAEPGFQTYLDLRMIMGCMGTREPRAEVTGRPAS